MRFVADDEALVSGRAHDVTHVVMPVLGLVRPRRNAMTVDVENHRIHDEITKARLLLRFAQSDACEVGVAVGMTAKLQPRIQLAMMRQQNALAVGADEPGGSGEMADPVRSLEDAWRR